MTLVHRNTRARVCVGHGSRTFSLVPLFLPGLMRLLTPGRFPGTNVIYPDTQRCNLFIHSLKSVLLTLFIRRQWGLNSVLEVICHFKIEQNVLADCKSSLAGPEVNNSIMCQIMELN